MLSKTTSNVIRFSKRKLLPEWGSTLHFLNQEGMDPLAMEIQVSLRGNISGKLVARMLGRVLNLFLGNPTYKSYLGREWDQLVDLYLEQVIRNLVFLRESYRKDEKLLLTVSGKLPKGFSRPFNQQPCTKETALWRVETIRHYCGLGDPILLMGDDDWVSLELLRAGFRNVTVMEIDPAVIGGLHRASQSENLQLVPIMWDLRKAPHPILIRDYRMVVLDPACNPESVNLFFTRALQYSRGGKDTLFLLNTHLMSQFPDGTRELNQFLLENRLEVRSIFSAKNVYPLSLETRRFVGSALSILNRCFYRRTVFEATPCSLPYFISDGLLLGGA